MPGRTMVFVGAPESHSLDWSAGNLLAHFSTSIAHFAGISTDDTIPDEERDSAVWRELPLDKARVSTGLSQSHAAAAPEFFSPTGEYNDQTILSQLYEQSQQLYEHSIMVHQEMPSSELVSESYETTSFITNASESFISDGFTQSQSQPRRQLVSEKEPLKDLKDLPSATYLQKILPQTMSVNVIAGIISVPQPRQVTTRWGTKYLVEVLVGDETRAGFTITYWLPSHDIAQSPLAGLRPGDIVLMQNVGLNAFMKKVYGSSLRKNLTKVHLLYRVRLDSRDPGGHYRTSDLSADSTKNPHPQLEKTRRVRDWVLNFVGRAKNNTDSKRPNPRRRWERPPEDETQLFQ
ncbi:hypothetical protein QBC35DRAFT_376979 [Podospora australis]|uniref:Uncharacterized protein n=1 Tax=Podospora australis TaxID=1536484 RepID=A0AAN7AMG8_9PEZI|nr:hypothetical protein QBC35DRAFT_376979 [Podospora australis]